ncbi:MAG: spermidine synthase [Guyparkeria sp.]|uniref:spermidine synthase n=1 Tax=Guyparkeria sp. TaxID=2035736 RepID=UPI00397B2361
MRPRVLERVTDEHGPIDVIEQGGEVALHFGNHTSQSAWRPAEPEKLCFAYYRAMTLPLALHPGATRIGILGLGGGVLAKFLLEHTESSIHAVDLRPALAPLAARHFGLALDHPRLTLRFGDVTAANWEPPAPLDVFLLDLFDQDGMVRLPDRTVERLAAAIAPGGMICLNLWRNHMPMVVEAHRQLSAHFHPDALVAHVPDRLNTVMTYRREPWQPADLEAGLKRLTAAPAPLRRAQGQAWQWLQPLRGQRR